ncbi:hypothetical protein ACOMICROBIO_LMKGKHOH_01088 [Vibrio sp. B1FIG11]|uniref:hypothetical protein n=1 Tax=Vibrio TaxID=662 RepID=UPI0013157446|nr:MULTISPECIES: hypothetical protein [Vibrio]CAD7799399.1 hypothetical protein ACOMICROBIO_LMKGKHOH_01088 [Vibrio sp. B1FIG11]CAE6884959.1 hypothetical protein ACOMICROBIO_LMKGKHOH_01088 [Vibrio sp. B1FIG11]HDM8222329.1 hypothetical protein [Vibrio campbellii]HDM8226800.1 hypothetical protein [Vibrio campbellii]
MMTHGNYDRKQALFYLIFLLISSTSLFIYSLKGISGFYDNITTKSEIATFDQVYVYMLGASFILFECLRILVISIISNNFVTKSQFKKSSKIFLALSITTFLSLYPATILADVFAKSNNYTFSKDESTYNILLEKRAYKINK